MKNQFKIKIIQDIKLQKEVVSKLGSMPTCNV